MNNVQGITTLRADMLSTVVPSRVHGGGPLIGKAADVLFLWRSCGTAKACGGSLCFFLTDDRLEAIWKAPSRYALEFRQCGVESLVEVDFSLWCDQSLEEQLHNVKRKKIVSRIFQEHGLNIIPNLNWADESSFRFCFAGIPTGAPVVACECRTAGGNDEDRRAFLKGLERAVRVVQPRHIVVYGGHEHAFWLTGRLPKGPRYTLLESFMTARSRIRARQAREAKTINQPELFPIGGTQWADADQAAA
jgi:hypothetical protein